MSCKDHLIKTKTFKTLEVLISNSYSSEKEIPQETKFPGRDND